MKANELRVGNWVNIATIPQQINSFYGIEIDTESYRVKIDGSDPHRVEAIPLTEEWLIKFGFEKNTGNKFIEYLDYSLDYYRKCIRIAPYVFEDNKPEVKEGYLFLFKIDVGLNYEHVADVYEVHHLQNLYFALTGEELEIK